MSQLTHEICVQGVERVFPQLQLPVIAVIRGRYECTTGDRFLYQTFVEESSHLGRIHRLTQFAQIDKIVHNYTALTEKHDDVWSSFEKYKAHSQYEPQALT